MTLPTSRLRIGQTRTQSMTILRTLPRRPSDSNSSPSTRKRQGPTTQPWSTSSRCWTNTPRTSYSSERPLCIHVVGPYSTHSVTGATKHASMHPTPRHSRTAFRKPASQVTSPTQAAGVGWPIRRKPHGNLWCRPSPYPRIALGPPHARWNTPSLMARKQPLSRVTSHNRQRITLGFAGHKLN